MRSYALPIFVATALLAGCGSDNDQVVTQTGPVTSLPAPANATLDVVTAAKLQQISNITRFAPTGHLDGQLVRPKDDVTASTGTPMNITVQQLELGYDTIFGSLSQTLGVTNATSEVQGNINFIANQTATGNWNLNRSPIANNTVGVTGVNFQPVTYNTTVQLPTGSNTVQVSGGLLMPLGINATQVKGVVLYFHGTTFSKSQVPSEYTANVETQLLAEVFASQGYIVVAPDYIGQGIDWQDVHPYVLYPTVSAKTALDMLNAVQPTIQSQYNFAPGAQLKLFSTGYSEGGSYSLWFNSFLQSTNGALGPLYRFTHAVGMEGAYSCSNVTYSYLFDDVSPSNGNPFLVQTQFLPNVVKPLLSADALLSYATYSVASNFGAVFQDQFFAMKATGLGVTQEDCNVNNTQNTIQQAFALPGTDISSPLLYSGLNKVNNLKQYVGLFTMLTGSSNSARSLVSSALLGGSGGAALNTTLQAADLNLGNVPDGSCSILTLDEDSVVVPLNFLWLQQKFPSKIRTAIQVPHLNLKAVSTVSRPDFVLWEPVDHLHGLVYEYLYALNIFNSF